MAFKETIKMLEDILATADVSKLNKINTVCRLELGGEEGGTAQIRLQNGTVKLQEGAPDSPDITISMPVTDFISLLNGKLNPTSAFMAGKLKIKGDMSQVFKLQELLSR